MTSPVQILAGMAAAGLVAGPQRPEALLAGAVAGVLPDAIDAWMRRLFRPPDVVVTPDPLAPDAALLATGVHTALRHAWERQQRCRLRLNPLPDGEGGHTAYLFDVDREHRAAILLGDRLARLDAMPAPLSPHHAVPVRVCNTPRDLLLSPFGKRIVSRDLSRVADIGHSFLPAALAAALAGAAGGAWLAAAAAAASLAHLLLDLGGRGEIAPWRPLSARAVRGRRFWDDSRLPTNIVAAAIAAAFVLTVVGGG